MRKHYLIFIICSLFTLWACYDDKGNYDYHDERQIVIEGLESLYRGTQYGDSLRISTIVIKNADSTTILPNDQFNFEWLLATTFSLNSVGKSQELKLGMNIDEKEYPLYLSVTDRTTGITTYAKTRLLVHSDLFEGWVFLCQDEKRNGMLDMLSFTYLSDTEKESKLLKNAWNSKAGDLPHPEKIFFRYGGAPRMALGFKDICYMANFKDHTIDPSDDIIYEMAILPERVQMQLLYKNFYSEYLISDNDLFAYATLEMIGRPINIYQGEKFKIAPYLIQTIYSTLAVVYDITNKRFMKCSVPRWGEPSASEMKAGDLFPWDAGWELMYMQPTRFQDYDYALLKDNNGDIHLCCFQKEIQKWHKIIGKGITNLDHATSFAFHKYAPIVYYACKDKLYEYNYGDPNPVEQEIMYYPDREIAKIYFHNIANSYNTDKEKYKDMDRRLCVAVNDMRQPEDTRGSFYIYRVENKETIQELESYDKLSYIIDFNYKEHSDY